MTVYSALYDKLKNTDLPLVRSGHIEDTSRSYVILTKVSNGLQNLDTCLSRFEQNIFQVTVHDVTFTGLLDKLGIVETLLENQTLNLTTKRFVSLLYLGSNLIESTIGLYSGWIQYEIITQKDFSSSYKLNTVEGITFQQALFTHYKNSNNLNNKVNGFVTTKFGRADWKRPFIFIPNYKIDEEFRTTCLTRGENYNFSFSVEGSDPDELEIIAAEIDNTYSYIRMSLTGNRRFTNLQWIGDSLFQLEPDLWEISVDYILLLEKS